MIRTAVIEDNFRLQQEIVEMVNKVPGFIVDGSADGVATGISLLNQKHPDLLLLDIALQDGTAFDILEATIYLNYKIIFLTAFEQYAIKAIKYGALDYLIKPLNESEFSDALRKVAREHSYKEQVSIALEAYTQNKQNARLVLRTTDHFQIISLDEIIYCHSDNGYTTFHLIGNRSVLTSKYLKEYEDVLPPNIFIRPHQSYFVNKAFIEFYHPDGWLTLKDKTIIPVAHRKRELIMEFIKGKA